MEKNIKKKIDYLIKITDKIGIIEHCCQNIPNYLEGYCTDDNARALQVCLRLKDQYPVLENVLPIYFNFLKSAIKENGCHNDLSQNLIWKNDCSHNSEHCSRALAAIGELSKSKSELALEAINIFDRLYSKEVNFKHIRIWSQIILGLKERQNYEDVKKWADLLVNKYLKEKTNLWKWWEPTLSYDIGRIPLALLSAYQITKNNRYLEIALESLDFLTEITFDEKLGCFVFPGNKGWFTKSGLRNIFDQQPIEAGSTTEAYSLAFEITKNKKYRDLALKAFSWYEGNNIIKANMVNPETGGIYDGFNGKKINKNQGAESVLAYLLAYNAIKKINQKEILK